MTTNGKPASDDDIPDWDYPEIADSHKTERTESGKTEIQDSRAIAKAVREGWIKEGDKRWPTNRTQEEIEKIPEDKRTLIEKAVLSVFQALNKESDPRVSGIAAKTAVTMEGQNQSDEHKVMPSEHVHSHQLTIDDRRSKLAAIDARLGTGGSGGVVVDEASGNGKSDHSAIGWVGGNGSARPSGDLPDDPNGKTG